MLGRRSTNRLITTFLVVITLLFSQLALASYVCPGLPDTLAMAEMMAAGEPCEGMDEAQPVLCHQYSSGAAQTFEAVKLTAPTQPAVVQILVVPLMLEAEADMALPMAALPEAKPPPDPLFLSTLRLRV